MVRRRGLLVVAVVVGLLASGCTSTEDQPDRGATTQTAPKAAVALAELPALAVPGGDTPTRGLVGDTWTVHLPASDDPAVPGTGIVGGVHVQLVDGPPGPLSGTKTYRVWDTVGNASTTPLWQGPTGEVPAGTLRNGDVYEYTVTNDAGDERGPFTFSVGASNPVAGAYQASIDSDTVTTGAGEVQVGLSFTTADVGTSTGTAAQNGLRGGLPPGWSWSGVGSGITQVVIEDASGFEGYDKVLEVHREGGDISLLGCRKAGSWGCDEVGGATTGPTLHAIFADDDGASLTVSDPTSGRTWSMETWAVATPGDPQDTLNRREGRVVSTAAPGTARTDFTYAGAETEDVATMSWFAAGTKDPLTWTFHRGGDAACGGDLPEGFVATPPGVVCGWTLPSGASVRLLHVAAGDDPIPQIGRAMRLPAGGCDPGSFAGCQDVWDQVAVTDLAWGASGHPLAMRDPGATQAVLAGAVAADDASMVTSNRYDALGRIDDVTAAAATPGAPRSVADHTYPAVDGSFPGATHQLKVAQRSSDGSISAITSAKAVDDGLREVGRLDPSGARLTEVWHADRDLQLARIGSDGTASTQVFDPYDRSIATYEVPTSALDLTRCVAGTTDVAACAPVGGWGEASGTARTYDGVGDPNGLIAEWFTSTSAAGVPAGRSAIVDFDDGTDSLVVPPPGVDLSGGGAVRISGALAPKAAPTSLIVDVKGGSGGSGWAFVNDRFYGGLANGSTTLELREGTKPLPYRFELVVSFTGAPPTNLSLIRRVGATKVALEPSDVRQRYGVVTQERAVEAFPAGSSTFKAVATSFAFGDLRSTKPDATTEVACGTAGSFEAALDACGSASGGTTSTATFEDDGNGGVRLQQTKVPGVGTTTYDYYGLTTTPDGSGLPADVAGAPQRGLLRSTTYPDGRVDTSAFDEEGQVGCRRVGSGPWSCTEHDGSGRVLREVYRADGSPDVVIEHDYGFDTGPSPRTDTVTRRDGDRVTSTEVARFTAGGNLASYEMRLDLAAGAGAAATTTYGYDAFERLVSKATTVDPGTGGGSPGSLETTMTYDPGSGSLASMTVGGKQVAVVGNDPNLQRISSVTYPDRGGAKVQLGYDVSGRPTTRTWSLAGGATIEDRTTVSAGGRILAASFDGVDTAYEYDGLGRLTAARSGDATALYAWDAGNNLVCTARGVAASVADCASAEGKVTNTYEGGRLTATTDAAWALPKDPYDARGNLLGAGERSFTYDARQQVAKIERPDATLLFGRDSTGRVISRAGESAEGTTRLLYAGPAEPTAVAELPPAAGPTFSLALPGGLLWTSAGAAIPDHQGSPAVWLQGDGTRDPDVATRRYDPFGVELAAPAPPAPDAATTTTTAAPTTTTTTAPASTTTTEAAPTTTAAPADASTATTAPADAAGEATTTTTEPSADTTTTAPPAEATTTTSEPASTTTAPADGSTTTTTAPTTEAAGPPLDVHGWSDRIALDDGLSNLGERMLIPSLGIFSGPDPVPGGSCTVYGYTCADPVNARDLTGTMTMGQGYVLLIGILFAFLMPATAPSFELALGAFVFQIAKQVVIGSLFAGVGGHVLAAVIDHDYSRLNWKDIGNAALTGAIAGGASYLAGSLLTSATRLEGELAVSSADYAFGTKVVEQGKDAVDDYGLYGRQVTRVYRTMGGPLSVINRFEQLREAGEAFFTVERTKLAATGLLIGTLKLGANQGTSLGMRTAEVRFGF